MNSTQKGSSASSLAASLMKGRRVLARRDSDGFYYLGRVIEVVSLAYFIRYIQYHHFKIFALEIFLLVLSIFKITIFKIVSKQYEFLTKANDS